MKEVTAGRAAVAGAGLGGAVVGRGRVGRVDAGALGAICFWDTDLWTGFSATFNWASDTDFVLLGRLGWSLGLEEPGRAVTLFDRTLDKVPTSVLGLGMLGLRNLATDVVSEVFSSPPVGFLKQSIFDFTTLPL